MFFRKSSSKGEGDVWVAVMETTQYKCNCFPPPLPSVPSLSAEPVSTVDLYGLTGQQGPFTHSTSPEGPTNVYVNGAEEHGC